MTRPGWAELWWVDIPVAGRRPVAVLNRPEAAAVLPRLVVAPASTVIRHLPTEVRLSTDDGVPRDCVLQLDAVERLALDDFDEFIAPLSAMKWGEVCDAIRAAINC